MTVPTQLTGLTRLSLRELFLQTALYRLAFLQGEREIVEPRAVDNALDTSGFPTLWNAGGPDKLDPDIHLQLRGQ